ncbi:glycosyltransferase family 4 protein [Desulfosporosinus hippei]|uniref:Glycosyltransferase involved in cell wall bisynthesis n=1 Tax=Desulfosporosinus hippei DSM 8344 TaxID=1121419 RepID=A0A1G7U682_9FIRM|nr:glycosyltransferase family 4 protein [Desulfosporosinus hippei]SDG43076.1 Glycosyltransferase involved in cell wall bisynthesis [Desulfosporosinus hippei DSM 8344]
MRFLILTQYFPPETGAAQVRLKELAKGLQRQGHEVVIVTAFPNHPSGVIPPKYRGYWSMKDEVEGLPVYRTWVYPVQRGRFWKRLLNYFSFTFSSLWGILKAGPCDVLFVESPPLFLGMTAVLGSWLKRARLVFNVSDLWPESAVALGLVTNKTMIRMTEGLETWLYNRSWKLSAVTIGIRDTWINRGIPAEKVAFLPNGVNLDLFRPLLPDQEFMDKLGLQDKFILAYTGTMGYAQGLETVLEAANLLRSEPQYHFLFLGDGTEKPKLEEMAKEMKLSNVQFLGFQPVTDMPRYLSLAAGSIIPLKKLKLFEGARPSKMFPAMGCAVPIIYSGEGEAVDLIRDAGAGLTVEPENPVEMAQAIRTLYNLSDRGKSMGDNGRRYVEENYSWDSIVSQWLKELK